MKRIATVIVTMLVLVTVIPTTEAATTEAPTVAGTVSGYSSRSIHGASVRLASDNGQRLISRQSRTFRRSSRRSGGSSWAGIAFALVVVFLVALLRLGVSRRQHKAQRKDALTKASGDSRNSDSGQT
jgi:hypothetical protein